MTFTFGVVDKADTVLYNTFYGQNGGGFILWGSDTYSVKKIETRNPKPKRPKFAEELSEYDNQKTLL